MMQTHSEVRGRYRQKYFEEAYRILEADAGKHFDPELVQVFIAIKDQVRAYLKEGTKGNEEKGTV